MLSLRFLSPVKVSIFDRPPDLRWQNRPKRIPRPLSHPVFPYQHLHPEETLGAPTCVSPVLCRPTLLAWPLNSSPMGEDCIGCPLALACALPCTAAPWDRRKLTYRCGFP